MSWACPRCRTVHDDGTGKCPNCEGGAVAKASAEAGATLYVAEGDPVPADVSPEVRLVGPGAPQPVAVTEAEPVPEPGDVTAGPEPEVPAEKVSAPLEPEPEAVPEPQGQVLVSTTSRPAGSPPDPSTQPENSGESSDPGDDDADDGPPDYATYPKQVLTDLCRERGLPAYGSKADMAARLTADDTARAAA